MKDSRLIKSTALPETLWCSSKKSLVLPPYLVDTWGKLLDKYDLRSLAGQPQDSVTGGITQDATNKHFAWRFTGSCARVQLAILDPKKELPHITDVFAKYFSGGHVVLTDIPCGSGAASLTILSILAELRRLSCIPREPLIITIIGGEISEYARQYALEGIELMRPFLEQQAIWVNPTMLHWDVCSKVSTADFVKQINVSTVGNAIQARVIIMANFSDFLHNENKWKEANLQIDQIFLHNRHKNSSGIWIEPQTNSVTKSGGFLTRIIKWINTTKQDFMKWIQPKPEDNKQAAYSSASVINPLYSEKTFDVNLTVMRFDLPETSNG